MNNLMSLQAECTHSIFDGKVLTNFRTLSPTSYLNVMY